MCPLGCHARREALGSGVGSRRRNAVQYERERPRRGGGATGAVIRCVDHAPDHRDHQKYVDDRQVTSDRAGCLGVAKRLLHQLREPPPGAVELGVEARVLSRKFPERIKAGNCLYDVPQQDEEGIGIAGVFGGQPLGAVHVLPEQCGGEATTIGKVPIEGRLADARSSSDLVQGDVGAVGEEFTRGSQYRLTIALSIPAPLGLASGRHGFESSTG